MVRSLVLPSALLLSFAVAACSRPSENPGPRVSPEALAAFAPLPEVITSESNPLTPEKVDLGRMLFFEKRLSMSQEFSCNSCHDLAKYGVDSQPFSTGHRQQKGGRNSPTVYNAAGHVAQFWDGRAASVEEQAKGPILNPVEMAMPGEEHVEEVLASIPGYVEAFQKAFPEDDDPITYENMARAIAAFERRLVTPSPWDRYLEGDENALSDEEKEGLAVFIETGCVTCHAGTYMGGHTYQKLGAVKPWPGLTDPGRYEVTKNEADRYVFKVPSLRNVAMTGPYLHDSSINDLETVVRMMAEHQLGKVLTDGQARSIVTFLHALTGEIPLAYIAAPELPPSGPNTPGPKLD